MNIKNYFLYTFLIIGLFSSYAQKDFFNLKSINDDLDLLVIREKDNKEFLFTFFDIIPVEIYKDSIVPYITKSLKNGFYIEEMEIKKSKITGWILYNCVEADEKFFGKDLPCVSANDIQLELMKKKFYRYKGNDSFLIRIDSLINKN